MKDEGRKMKGETLNPINLELLKIAKPEMQWRDW